MHSRLALLLATLQLVVAESPMIDTPSSVVQCQPVHITYSKGTPPYYIALYPPGQTDGPPIEDLGMTSEPSKTWIANLPAGTSFSLQIRDSQGFLNYAQVATVQPSADSSCLKGGPSVPPSAMDGKHNGTPPSGSSSSSLPGNSSSKPGSATTMPTNNSSSAASNAPNSAASADVSINSMVTFGGLALATSMLALFA